MMRNRMGKAAALLCALALILAMGIPSALAEDASTRWADASDEIDRYLDTAFEDFLAGDAQSAYNNVNDAYLPAKNNPEKTKKQG